MKTITVLWDFLNVYRKTFGYALIIWTLFLLGTGALTWIMHQNGPHPGIDQMTIGKNGWTGEYEGAYNTLGAIIYLKWSLKLFMILFTPLLGGYFLMLYKADHAEKFSMNSLFSFYWSKTGVVVLFLSLIKASIIILDPPSVLEMFFIKFPLIIFLDSLLTATAFIKIHPRQQNFWRKLFLGWFLMMGIYLILLLVCSLIIGLLYLISTAFQKPMNETSFMIFMWISLMIVVAASYLLNHFYFSGIYVFYRQFVLRDKNRPHAR